MSIKAIPLKSNELYYCSNLDCPCRTPKLQTMAELEEKLFTRTSRAESGSQGHEQNALVSLEITLIMTLSASMTAM